MKLNHMLLLLGIIYASAVSYIGLGAAGGAAAKTRVTQHICSLEECRKETSLKCTNCGAPYCSKEHQRKDWGTHKRKCHKQKAAKSQRRINVLLLAEQHGNMLNAVKNAGIINGALHLGDAQRQAKPDEILFISEGRGINACYLALRIPKRIIMQEHNIEEQSEYEMFDKFYLLTQLFLDLIKGKKIYDPMKNMIDIEWIRNRAENDGYINLFIKNQIPHLHEELLTSISEKNMDKYLHTMTLILDEFNTRFPCLQDVITRIAPDIFDTSIISYFREIRDQHILERIIEKVSKDKRIKFVVIIFGLAHYENIARIIGESPLLQLHEASSDTID